MEIPSDKTREKQIRSINERFSIQPKNVKDYVG